MSARLVLLIGVTVAFAVLSALAVIHVGYVETVAMHFQNWGLGQVFADLAILAILACIWMVGDARARGLNAWPFVAITLFAGSFGPLSYLIARELRSSARQPASA